MTEFDFSLGEDLDMLRDAVRFRDEGEQAAATAEFETATRLLATVDALRELGYLE